MSDAAMTLYRLYGADGDLLYVGITASFQSRMRAHQRDKAWWSEVEKIQTEPFGDWRSVVEAEQLAIISERPRYNRRTRPWVPASPPQSWRKATGSVGAGDQRPSSLRASAISTQIGRPEIGGRATFALGERLLQDVDVYAEAKGLTRAQAIRTLLADALDRAIAADV